MKKMRGVKLDTVVSLRHNIFNKNTTGVIYKEADGFYLEFQRILDIDSTGEAETELAHFYLSSEDDLDGEDLININEILEANHLEFINYLKGA